MPAGSPSSLLAAFVTAAGAASEGDVLASAALQGPLTELAGLRVALYAANADGTALRMVGHSGGDEMRAMYSTLPVDDQTPNAVAFRTGTELFLSLEDAVDAYPLLTSAVAIYAGNPDIEVAFVPLRHAGRTVGVAGLLFASPVPRTWESRALLDAVVAVLGLWCAAHRSDQLASRPHRALALTPRQREILRLAGEGRTNAQIAADLGFAESTVKADLTHIYRLTGAVSRQELIDRLADLNPATD